MKNRALKQAAAVSAIAVVLAVLIHMLRTLCVSGGISGGFADSFTAQLEASRRPVIAWAIFILAAMLFSGRISFGRMAFFSLVTVIGYSILDPVLCGIAGGAYGGLAELPSVAADIGHYAYPAFFVAAAFLGVREKKLPRAGLSILWLVSYCAVMAVFAPLKNYSLMGAASFSNLYNAVFISAPALMLGFIAAGYAKSGGGTKN